MGDQLQALDQVRGTAITSRSRRKPARVISVARLADSCVTIGVGPWVKVPDYVPAVGEINRAILEAFRSRNIVIPMPQREVRMIGAGR